MEVPTLKPKFIERTIVARGLGLVRIAGDLVGIFQASLADVKGPERMVAVKLPATLAPLASYAFAEHRLRVREPIKTPGPSEFVDWLGVENYVGGETGTAAMWVTRHTLTKALGHWRRQAEAKFVKRDKTPPVVDAPGGTGSVRACTLAGLLGCDPSYLPTKAEDGLITNDFVSCIFSSFPGFAAAMAQTQAQFKTFPVAADERTPAGRGSSRVNADPNLGVDELRLEVSQNGGDLTVLHAYRADAMDALFHLWICTKKAGLDLERSWFGPAGWKLHSLPDATLRCIGLLLSVDPEDILAEAECEAEDLDARDVSPSLGISRLLEAPEGRLAYCFLYPQKLKKIGDEDAPECDPVPFWLTLMVARLRDVLMLALATLAIIHYAKLHLNSSSPSARLKVTRNAADFRLEWLTKATRCPIPTNLLNDPRKAKFLVQLFGINQRAQLDEQDAVRVITQSQPLIVDQRRLDDLKRDVAALHDLCVTLDVEVNTCRIDEQLMNPLGGPQPDTEHWLDRHARRSLVIVPADYLALCAGRSDVLRAGEEWPLFITDTAFIERVRHHPDVLESPQLSHIRITDVHAYTVARLIHLLETIKKYLPELSTTRHIAIFGCADLLATTRDRDASLLAVRHLNIPLQSTAEQIETPPPLLASLPLRLRAAVVKDGEVIVDPAPRLWLYSETYPLTKFNIEQTRTKPGGGEIVRATQLAGRRAAELHITQGQLDKKLTADELTTILYLMAQQQNPPLAVVVHPSDEGGSDTLPTTDALDLLQFYLRRMQMKYPPQLTVYWNTHDH